MTVTTVKGSLETDRIGINPLAFPDLAMVVEAILNP
jgi:hypothetical protein